MSPDFIASVLGKIGLALLPTFAFIMIASFLEFALLALADGIERDDPKSEIPNQIRAVFEELKIKNTK